MRNPLTDQAEARGRADFRAGLPYRHAIYTADFQWPEAAEVAYCDGYKAAQRDSEDSA